MTLIALRWKLSIFLLCGTGIDWMGFWLSGYSFYDVQISTRYNDVYDEADLPRDNYELVTEFLASTILKPLLIAW